MMIKKCKIKIYLILTLLITHLVFYNIKVFQNLPVDNIQTDTYEDQLHVSIFPPLSPTQNRLEFVHITKTGGSAIEKLASEHNTFWGACHFANNTMLNCFSRNHVPWRELYIGTAW